MAFQAGSISSNLILNLAQWDKSVNKVNNQLKNLNSKVQANAAKFKAAGSAITKAGAGIVGSLTGIILHTTKLGDTFNKMSIRTGISTKTLSSLKFAAEQAGSNLETVEKGLRRLSANMLDANRGLAEAKRGFDDLGISVNDSNGNMKSTEGIMLEVAEKFKGMEDGALKSALAQDIFGRAGANLIPLLNQGSEGIEALTEQAEKLGIVFSEEDAQAAADLTDNMNALKKSFSGVFISIANTLIPIVSDLALKVSGVVSSVSAWIKEHPTLTKIIFVSVGALGALMTIVGPLLIALPHLVAGITLVSGAITTKLIPAVIKLAPILWATLAPFLKIAAAFVAGWAVGRTISNILNLDKHVQKLIGSFQKTQEEWDNLHRLKMGFTQEATELIKIRRELMALGENLGVSSGKLRVHVQAIRANEEAYNSLSPKMKDYVDTHHLVQAAVEKTEAAERVLSDELIKLKENLNTRIKELALDETEFKLFQLEQEHQARLTDLEKAGAIQIEFQLAERLHQLEVKKIRDQARQKEEAERKEHLKKVAEAIKKADEEKRKLEDESNKFVLQLIKDKEALELEAMKRRGELRAAELIEVNTWEEEQLNALDTRLTNGLISFEQFLQARAILEENARLKREKANNDEEKRDEERRKRNLEGINAFVEKWGTVVFQTIGTLSKLNEAYTDVKISNLEAWYESEKQRINDNVVDQGERERQLEDLEVQFANKKASVQAASAKKEKKLAIASAIANTAVAVTKAMTTLAWPFNLPAIAFAIATGAAQIAAIGGAYNAPSAGSFAPGAGSSGGAAGGGGGSTGGSPGKRGEGGVPKFAEGGRIGGNNLEFISGEEGPEFIQKRGNLLTITPIQGGDGLNGGSKMVNITIQTIDTRGMRELFENELKPMIRSSFDDNDLTVPVTALESA
jgi:TP901 family phage tail tape measure protein